MGNVQAIIDLSEELYLSLSASGLTKEKIAGESRKLLALKCFKENSFHWVGRLNYQVFLNGIS